MGPTSEFWSKVIVNGATLKLSYRPKCILHTNSIPVRAVSLWSCVCSRVHVQDWSLQAKTKLIFESVTEYFEVHLLKAQIPVRQRQDESTRSAISGDAALMSLSWTARPWFCLDAYPWTSQTHERTSLSHADTHLEQVWLHAKNVNTLICEDRMTCSSGCPPLSQVNMAFSSSPSDGQKLDNVMRFCDTLFCCVKSQQIIITRRVFNHISG